MPRKNRKQLNIILSEQQFAAIHAAADTEAVELSDYVRGLIRRDVIARGGEWPDDLPGRGKYARQQNIGGHHGT